MMFRTSPPFWQIPYSASPPGPVSMCPLNSYRELTIPVPPEGFVYSSDIGSALPRVGFSTAHIPFRPSSPSLHGACWILYEREIGIGNELYIEITDPTIYSGNTLYYELAGGSKVYIDVQDEAGNITENFVHVQHDQDAYALWNRHRVYMPGKYVKRVKFKFNAIAGGIAYLINVRVYCSDHPEFAPMEQEPVYPKPFSIPSGLTITAPPTISSTYEIIDSTGAPQSAIYYPQSNDGASDYGSTWVLGSPIDTPNVLVIDVNNTSVDKFDALSFESNGSVQIEVWDEYANLAGPASYFWKPTALPNTEWGKWTHYRSFPLVHPPIGLQGNIKRVRLTGLDPETLVPLTNTSPNILPASIWKFQLFPANSVSPRTDRGTLTYY